MNCRVCLAVRTSLSNDRARRGGLFSGILFELYRTASTSPPVFWKPSIEEVETYVNLQQTLESLPRVLATVVKKSCSASDKSYEARQRGTSLLHLLIDQLHRLNSRVQTRKIAHDVLKDARDELTFIASFPTTDYDYSIFNGVGHAAITLENDLRELREMLLNDRPKQTDATAIVYDCRRILRKANLLRWVMCVFLYTCLPLFNQPWSLPQPNLQEHIQYRVRQGLDRLRQLECLVQPFWNHRAVKSARRGKKVEVATDI